MALCKNKNAYINCINALIIICPNQIDAPIALLFIIQRVATISEVVSNNSAASEETAAVSEEQTAQVQTMVELMGQFQV